MAYDEAAQALLLEVIEDWTACGIFPTIREVTSEVWPRNLDRHEPDLGDDAMSLGVQSSRNVRNLAVRRLQEDGHDARVADHTLVVKRSGRVLHINKARAVSSAWDIDTQRWDDSEVRLLGARANSQAYFPSDGALFAVRAGDPQALKHLHLTWQGLEHGPTRAWVGFPRIGDVPWFAVAPLAEADPVQREHRPPVGPLQPSPNFDAMQTREPEVKLKPQGNGSQEGVRPAGPDQS
ncbi:hypothetical protein DQ244_08065 [Blastococcus sp. TBT05-19]|uniref:hypothetical protein n=1 Tax=Blastococcus sp. TBT05-19 TaxID=2250581 RepID=UPI000DEB91F6|nr:hypothetical protein [Blastococcus sp. TBT05-19]RBY92238.1 hypothetical protein DQ244_08065 [Blastococcus sp. TBT05-19]